MKKIVPFPTPLSSPSNFKGMLGASLEDQIFFLQGQLSLVTIVMSAMLAQTRSDFSEHLLETLGVYKCKWKRCRTHQTRFCVVVGKLCRL